VAGRPQVLMALVAAVTVYFSTFNAPLKREEFDKD